MNRNGFILLRKKGVRPQALSKHFKGSHVHSGRLHPYIHGVWLVLSISI